jgi:hypothetical protein
LIDRHSLLNFLSSADESSCRRDAGIVIRRSEPAATT